MFNREKIIIIFILEIISLSYSFTWASKATAVYSESVELFELIDNASQWSNKSIKEYKSAIDKKIKFTQKEYLLLKKYSTLRRREYETSKMNGKKINQADIFGPVLLGHDYFSKAFYTNKTIRGSLLSLRKSGVAQKDIEFLNRLFESFTPRLKALTKESAQLPVKMIELNRDWKKSGRASALKIASNFILGTIAQKLDYKLYPVWSPANLKSSIDIRGSYLILRYNPLTQAEKWDLSDALAKLISSTLNFQPLKQRKRLSQLFKLRCNGREYELQESLKIVFSEMLPDFTRRRKKFNLHKRWSKKNFTDLFAKLLFPLMQDQVRKRQSFSDLFMEQSSFLCRQLHQLATRV